MSTFAENEQPGALIEWPKAPGVAAPIGLLPFAAPSARGQVHSTGGGVALVRFQYRNPTGGMSWSSPIEVLPGQACTLVTDR